jgi:hypothetical protein
MPIKCHPLKSIAFHFDTVNSEVHLRWIFRHNGVVCLDPNNSEGIRATELFPAIPKHRYHNVPMKLSQADKATESPSPSTLSAAIRESVMMSLTSVINRLPDRARNSDRVGYPDEAG